MSEFLMIVPDGYIEIPNPESMYSLESWQGCYLGEATEWLKVGGYCQEGMTVVDKRVFKDGDVVRLWVLIQPE